MNKFTVGQVVSVTNGYGVNIGIKTITGIDKDGRYFLSPTETPWYSWREEALQASSKDGKQ